MSNRKRAMCNTKNNANNSGCIVTRTREGDESSESENETEPAKAFVRKISTNKSVNGLPATKEGFLMKQTWSFQRWRRRFFRLRGRVLYYAKDKESSLFDEIELIDPSYAECSIKNINHSFQVITPCRSLVLCAETRKDMEEWLAALKGASPGGAPDILTGDHHWYATSHARPTYCNVCREGLHGVPPHGLSCEVCKFKAHKRCAARAPPNCKWTTLASVGSDIIEDGEGNIQMPHQWMEGNLPVASKCAICDKTCGSVLRLQDWRCLWCRYTVHSTCRPHWRTPCPLPPWRVSLVPPTALHATSDDGWHPSRPPHASPLLVFVNSKSGDNQGVKFLRRFKQLLNPAQVFDLTAGGGPGPGLRLFRHMDPFRVLVCSGDGSVGWVLAEIDNLNMHKQCQVAVLPLGTGNDLARVLGWGAACDDDAHLPLLLERYEQASSKMLDRWSIMAFERPLPTSSCPGEKGNRQAALEEAIHLQLEAINQSIETGSNCTQATECLRVAVRELAGNCGGERGREARACLAALLDAVRDIHPSHKINRDKTEKDEENQRARMGWSNKEAEVRKRLDSLSRAVAAALHPADAIKAASSDHPCSWELLPAPREFADSRRSSAVSDSGNIPEGSVSDVDDAIVHLFPLCGSQSSKSPEALSSKSSSPYLLGPAINLESVNAGSCANLTKLGDTPEPAEVCDVSLFRVPSLVVSDTAMTPTDEIVENITFTIGDMYESDKMTIIDMDVPYTVDVARNNECLANNERIPVDSPCKVLHSPDEEDKDLSDVLSAMSNEECSLGSEGLDQKAFHPTQGGDDNNEHINHIDSPETSDTTCPNSETIHGESMLDDMSSVLGQDLVMAMVGKNGDLESTFTDETTLFTSETTSELPLDSRNPSLEKYDDRIFNFLRRVRKTSKELEEKFGFENKVFNISSNNEPIKYCSLAQFVEGNDIARKSFKKHLRHSKKVNNKKEQQGDAEHLLLCEETETLRSESRRGSCSNLSGVASIGGETVILNRGNIHLSTRIKEDFDGETTSQKDTSSVLDGRYSSTVADVPKLDSFLRVGGNTVHDEKKSSPTTLLSFDVEMDDDIDDRPRPSMFPRVSVVVEPPSPSSSEGKKGLGGNGLSAGLGFSGGLGPAWPRERRCSDNGPRTSLDVERCSSATRRISCGSLFQPGEADRLSKSASSIWGGGNVKSNITKGQKQLPIINPLVRLPAWPHVEGGLVGRCLLANADALCAAVSPLMDPQETLLEGFYERSVMNNYFGIGIDAKISLDFHQKREEHPEKCRSRARNYMWYGVLGSREWLQRTYRHLGQRVQLECDGQRIPLPELQGIVVMNIPSFMGGTNFWGTAGGPHSPFLAPSFDDRVLEVVAVFGSAQMAASRLINLQRHRIAQCRNVQINILGTEGVPVQVDGEAWLQPPGMIRIMHKNRAQVLCRSRQLETSLKSWGEKQKLCVTGGPGGPGGSGGGAPAPSSHLSVEPPPDELPAAELAQLLIFIETANTLVKWVKMSSITGTGNATAGGAPSSSAGGSGSCLYDRACTAAGAVDALTPGGRLLPANTLRTHLATLAKVLGELCTAAEAAGGGPPLQQAVRSARQQLALVREQGGIASLQPPDSEAEQTRSRRGWLRGAASRRASSAAAGTVQGAAHWDTAEVGAWLASLQLAEYAEVFAKHDVTGRELSTLARRDLKDMGITKVGHVKRILQAIKDLQ